MTIILIHLIWVFYKLSIVFILILLGSSVWSTITPTGFNVIGRSGHSAVITSRNTMIVFGGITTNERTNELLRFDYSII